MESLCALLFVSSRHFLNLVVHRLDSQAKGDGVVRPFARAALYRDDLLAVTAQQGLFLNQLELNILAGGVTARVPACSLSRRCSYNAGGNLKRSELGRGLQLRMRELCLWPLGKTAMVRTLVGVLLFWHGPCGSLQLRLVYLSFPTQLKKNTLKDSNWSD